MIGTNESQTLWDRCMKGTNNGAQLGCLSILIALGVMSPIFIAGVPLDTPDGFLHVGWSVGWVKAIKAGWYWPTWSELQWAGAGSNALLIYPPLFRYFVGIPILVGLSTTASLNVGLLMVCLVNSLGSALLAKIWLKRGLSQYILISSSLVNPYFLVNMYVRGAWPEALAQGFLWWLALGFVGISRRRKWGTYVAGCAICGIVLSNWNVALLAMVAWVIAGIILSLNKGWWSWATSCGLGVIVTLPFTYPALAGLESVKKPIPGGILDWEFFLHGVEGMQGFGSLLWVQTISLLALVAYRGTRSRKVTPIAIWSLTICLLSIYMCYPLSGLVYSQFTVLQKIQFPWRWLSIGWLGGIIWFLSTEERNALPRNRRSGLASMCCMIIGMGAWFDGVWKFRNNFWGHASTAVERNAVDILFDCDPLKACPEGIKVLPRSGEVAKRFVALPDGRVALAGIADYSPKDIPGDSWNKRLDIFWIPRWPQDSWVEFIGEGNAELVERSPTKRRIMVDAKNDGMVRIMQWSDERWNIYLEQDGIIERVKSAGRDRDGWISIKVRPGHSEIIMSYRMLGHQDQ